MSDKITLRCLKQGCPRVKKGVRAEDIPAKVAEIHSYCPWHEEEGWKAYPELFFDKKGRRLDPETFKLM
jgi:hypothetical protein